MAGTFRDDDERFLKAVEQRLGWSLPAEQQTDALRQRRRGDSPELVARRLETDEIAGRALNDRKAPLRAPATRPVDDDPRHFPRVATQRR